MEKKPQKTPEKGCARTCKGLCEPFCPACCEDGKEVGGLKHDGNKPPVDLLSTDALEQIARVLGFGATKYARHNWRKGIAWSRVVAAAMRHLLAWKDGEDLDEESGLSHLAHAGCCVMFLLEYLKTHPEFDDRYKHETLEA